MLARICLAYWGLDPGEILGRFDAPFASAPIQTSKAYPNWVTPMPQGYGSKSFTGKVKLANPFLRLSKPWEASIR